MMHFEPIEDKEIKARNGSTVYREIRIMQDFREVGRIFTPSGSGEDTENAIQVCGFTEAFDLWGCGIFKGYKDIQLLFDEGIMGGKETTDLNKCCRCYRYPCQCENKANYNVFEKEDGSKKHILPFNVKSSFDKEFQKRLRKKVI